MRKYVKYILVLIFLILFGIIAFNVYKDNEFYSDGFVYDFVSKYFITDSVTPFIKFITWFGSAFGIIVMALLSLFVFKSKKISVSMTVCLILGTAINNVLKIIFARPRPSVNPLVVETSHSFPSGHSMMSMIFYGYLIYLVYNHLENKWVKWIFVTVLSISIVCIGFTRIYLGVHYFSDIIGGFALGFVYLVMYIDVSKKIIKKI